MSLTKKQHSSLNLSLKLKEFGFDEPCHSYSILQKQDLEQLKNNIYIDAKAYSDTVFDNTSNAVNYNDSVYSISRPEHWQVIEWIYEKYQCWIHISHVNYFTDLEARKGFVFNINRVKTSYKIENKPFVLFQDKYESVEHAIEYFIDNINFYTNV